MIYIIIGNIIALIAALLMVYSGLIKNKKKLIYIQTIQIGLSVLSNIVLGGITGAIINAISCFRNILYHKNILTIKYQVLIVLLSIGLSLYFNNLGLIGLLPVISSITYTIFINIKNIIHFKLLIIFTMILWFAYDMYIKSYSSAIFDFLNIVTTSISIYQLNTKNKHK